MASKTNKISIRPMNNAAAIASTLGIQTSSAPKTGSLKDETVQREAVEENDSANSGDKGNAPVKTKSNQVQSKASAANRKIAEPKRSSEATQSGESVAPASGKTTPVLLPETTEMPLLIDIKRRFPGKELFVLCLLYLQRNHRGLVQMTVNQIMTLYGTVFVDVIKDDTVRRSLKRLFDGAFIKTTSIPGNNSGYIYQIEDLLETNLLSEEEKEEFGELIEFAKRKLNL